MNVNSKILYFFYSMILFLSVIFCIYNDLIFFYINPIVNDHTGEIARFGDWTVVVDAIVCLGKGFDVYLQNPCDVSTRPHVYGEIILHLPLVTKYYFFYSKIIPLLLIFLTITAIVFLFKPKNLHDFFLTTLIVFSTPILLLIERANLELVIFLFLILISYSRNYYFTHLSIFIISGLKFYPAVSSIIFFFENQYYKIFSHLFISICLFLLAIFIGYDGLKTIYLNKNITFPDSVENVGMYIFSFQALPQLAKSTSLELQLFNSDFILNITSNFLIFIIILLTILNFNYLRNISIDKNLELNNFEGKLFLTSSLMILVIFFFPNMNYLYKEIYFIGLIPFLGKNYFSKNLYYKYFYNLIISKFLLLTLLWFLQTIFFQKSLYIKGINILVKNLFDNLLIIIILSFILIFIKNIFQNLKRN